MSKTRPRDIRGINSLDKMRNRRNNKLDLGGEVNSRSERQMQKNERRPKVEHIGGSCTAGDVILTKCIACQPYFKLQEYSF